MDDVLLLNVLNVVQYETDSMGDPWEDRLPTLYGWPWIDQILYELFEDL